MRRPRIARSRRSLGNPLRLALVLALAGAAFSLLAWLSGKRVIEKEPTADLGRLQSIARLWGWEPKQEAWPDTLVVYIFSNTDPDYFDNLKHFLRWGLREGDGAYYIIVVQDGGKSPIVDLEEVIMPGNARLLYHDNECYDWGTLGWIMSAGIVDIQDYKYFVMINSSVRGPYAPPYQPAKEGLRKMIGLSKEQPAWHKRLTSLFDDATRLVGPRISCHGTLQDRGRSTPPHVESHAIAVDQEALHMLQKNGTVMKCQKSHADFVWYADVGASAAVLEAGYNMASLQHRYEGIDWRDKRNWKKCSEGGADAYDTSLQEALFIEKREGKLLASEALAQAAAKYERWLEEQSAGEKDKTMSMFPDWEVRLPEVAMMNERGPNCFDFAYYRSLNTDLGQLSTEEQLWGHFLHFGQFERRPFRFTCDWDPPAGHDWAGYPIRAASGVQGVAANKPADPKKQYRAIRPIPLPKVDFGFYNAQLEDSAPEAQNREGSASTLETDWDFQAVGEDWQRLRYSSRQMLQGTAQKPGMHQDGI